MFDIAFSELIVIAIIALLVIGPEQMPKVARTAGRWFGKMRQFVRTVQADIEREIRAEELKRIMDEQARSSGVYDILEQAQDASDELKRASAEVESLKVTAASHAEHSAGSAPAADADSGTAAAATDNASASPQDAKNEPAKNN